MDASSAKGRMVVERQQEIKSPLGPCLHKISWPPFLIQEQEALDMSTPSKPRKPKPTSTGQRIKAVVRKLPPNLPEDLFWRSCELWVNDNTVKEKWFRKGDMKGL